MLLPCNLSQGDHKGLHSRYRYRPYFFAEYHFGGILQFLKEFCYLFSPQAETKE